MKAQSRTLFLSCFLVFLFGGHSLSAQKLHRVVKPAQKVMEKKSDPSALLSCSEESEKSAEKAAAPLGPKGTALPGTPSDLRISLEHTACFGPCPVYRISVNGQGQVAWDGRKHVETQGFALKNVDPMVPHEFYKRLEEMNLWKMNSRYARKMDGCTSVVTDNPWVKVELIRNGAQKRVEVYQGCRGSEEVKKLVGFAKDLNAALDAKTFIGEKKKRRRKH